MNNLMTPELKQAWVDALKRGNYRKGGGQLYAYGCYCCLAVLADIRGDLKNNEHRNEWYVIEQSGGHNFVFYGVEQCLLDMETAEKLAHINDHTEDFTKVIAYIEENITPAIPDTTLEAK